MKTSMVLLPVALLSLGLVSSAGAITQYVAFSSHSDRACSSAPVQVAYVVSSNGCSATSAACVADEATSSYLATTCVTDAKTHSTSLFGSKPWLQFEIYKSGSSCGSLASLVGYLADGSCLVVDNASSSLKASVFVNKSASIATFDGTSCSGSPTKSHLLPATNLAKASCIDGRFLAYTGDATTVAADASTSTTTSGVTPSPSAGSALVATALAAAVSITGGW